MSVDSQTPEPVVPVGFQGSETTLWKPPPGCLSNPCPTPVRHRCNSSTTSRVPGTLLHTCPLYAGSQTVVSPFRRGVGAGREVWGPGSSLIILHLTLPPSWLKGLKWTVLTFPDFYWQKSIVYLTTEVSFESNFISLPFYCKKTYGLGYGTCAHMWCSQQETVLPENGRFPVNRYRPLSKPKVLDIPLLILNEDRRTPISGPFDDLSGVEKYVWRVLP